MKSRLFLQNRFINVSLYSIVITISLLLFVFFSAAKFTQNRLLEGERSLVEKQVAPYGLALQSMINNNFVLLEGLAAFVQTHPTEEELQAAFVPFAAGLHANKKEIRSLQVFPLEVPEHLYPGKGNEVVIGGSLKRLLNDERPNVKEDVHRAITTRQMVRSAPYELRQSGLGLVARKAIYHQDAFWGLVTIVLNVPPILEASGITNLSESFVVTLKDRNGRVFWQTGEAAPDQPIDIPIKLVDGEWIVSAAPSAGWMAAIRGSLTYFLCLEFTILFLLGSLIFLILGRQSYLSRRVSEQTSALAASRERYQLLFDANSDALFLLDQQGRILDANKRAEARYGYNRQELLQMNVSSLYPAEMRQNVPEKIRRALQHTIQFESKHKKKDDTEIPVEIFARAAVSGDQTFILGSVRDISERKRAEAIVAETETKFRALVEQSITGIYSFHSDSFHYANSRFAEIFGYTVEEVISTLKPTDVIAAEDKAMAQEQINSRLSGEKKEAHYFARGKRKDGTLIWIEIHGTQVKIDGKPCVTGTVLDITARREAEIKLAAHKDDLEAKVLSRTLELQKIVSAMADREIRMIQLKEEISMLRSRLEKPGLS